MAKGPIQPDLEATASRVLKIEAAAVSGLLDRIDDQFVGKTHVTAAVILLGCQELFAEGPVVVAHGHTRR